jgi:hypothetical protein
MVENLEGVGDEQIDAYKIELLRARVSNRLGVRELF